MGHSVKKQWRGVSPLDAGREQRAPKFKMTLAQETLSLLQPPDDNLAITSIPENKNTAFQSR